MKIWAEEAERLTPEVIKKISATISDDEDIQEGWSQCSDFDDDINFDNYRGE